MSRPSVLQGVQVGVETTPGTPAAANKRLMNSNVILRPQPRVSGFRAAGSKVETHITQAKELGAFGLEMPSIGYNDLAYWLSSLLRVATGTWTFDLTPFGADSIKTLTLEGGSATRAERMAHCVLSDLEFRFTETEASASGSGFGAKREEGATITPTPTKLAAVGVSPKDVSVLVGTNVAGLAEIDNPLETRFGIRGRHRPGVYLNSDPSLSGHVERAPELSSSLVLVHDSVGAGYMADLRASTQRVMRILCSGPTVGLDTYSLQISFPFTFREADPGDMNDEYVSTFRLGPDYEATDFDSAVEIVLDNTVTAL